MKDPVAPPNDPGRLLTPDPSPLTPVEGLTIEKLWVSDNELIFALSAGKTLTIWAEDDELLAALEEAP